MRVIALGSLIFAACGTPTVLEGKSYATSCVTSADCVGVFEGDQCEPCACPNLAIATTDQVTYAADRSAAIAACEQRLTVACAPCAALRPTCVRHTSPVADEGPSFCELRRLE